MDTIFFFFFFFATDFSFNSLDNYNFVFMKRNYTRFSFFFSFSFGHFEVFEDFSLVASFFKYSSTSSCAVSYLLLVVPKVLF